MDSVRGNARVFGARIFVLAAVALHSAAGVAAERAVADPQSTLASALESQEELGEVLVVGGYEPIWDHQVLIGWLTRLIGEFEVSGTLKLLHRDNGTVLDAEGAAACIGFQGRAVPAVHCDLDVRWPTTERHLEAIGGTSTLQPAAMLFGYSVGRGFTIRHMLVDSDGRAEGASGYLISPDILVSREECHADLGACERIVRITAGPDLQRVVLEITISIERRVVQTLTLTMKRRA